MSNQVKDAAKRVVERAKRRMGSAWNFVGPDIRDAVICQEMMMEVYTAAAFAPDDSNISKVKDIAVMAREAAK